ncbi:MAG: sortase [Actinomycetota bacterium]
MQHRRRAWLPALGTVAVLLSLQGTGFAGFGGAISSNAPGEGAASHAKALLGRAPAQDSYAAAMTRTVTNTPARVRGMLRSGRTPLRYRPHGPAGSFDPAPGEPVFHLRIPSIGVDEVVLHGTEQAQLARGPGHYPSCRGEFEPPYCDPIEEVWPGEVGRTIVAGHRTLGGADFLHLDRLSPGDRVRIEASWGLFEYEIVGSDIVDPLDRSIVMQRSSFRELVLVTCHPKYSAARRLLYVARLREALPPG